VIAALLGGGGLGVGLDDFTDVLAVDPERRRHLRKVEVVDDPRCTELFPTAFPAVLTAQLRDGREVRQEIMQNRGGPDRPLTDAELERKFADTAGRRLTQSQLEQVEDAVTRLDQLDDIGRALAPATQIQEELKP
jgi:2-methylcitrate dehydratase PrpD